MRTEISINGSAAAGTGFIAWAPIRTQIRLTDAGTAADPVDVRLRNQDASRGGQVVFFSSIPGNGQAELQLTLPLDGSAVDFFVAGQFGRPSIADGDAAIEVIEAGTNLVLSVTPLMVRVRKNANELTTAERNRFLSTLATLNDRGMGRFSDFRNMHTNAGSPEAHGNAAFLPWHRAYLLDLERQLQRIDASVALPYWRFDQPARKLFTQAFMGIPTPSTGTVRFSAGNPLQFWMTDQSVGVVRTTRFNTQTEPAIAIDEITTLTLGGANDVYGQFLRLEGNPHGAAHVSFGGFISSIHTAARDPLFFLLHANIDRLWAKWQWIKRRFDITNAASYSFQGSAGDPGATRIGHNLDDTMWPWNNDTTPPRPPTAPGGGFPSTVTTNAPGASPTVRDMVDYQGVASPGSHLGFGYDDVPFEI